MTQQIIESNELSELKDQFALMTTKLEKQKIINDELLKESMTTKLSHIERWYHFRFRIDIIAAPIISIVSFAQYMNEGFRYWGFSLLVLAIGLTDFLLNRKSYKILDISNLPNLSMTNASEKVVRHKQLHSMINKIFLLPMTILIVWTIAIACNYTWNLQIIALVVFMLVVSISFGIRQMKRNRKRLETVLHQIKLLNE